MGLKQDLNHLLEAFIDIKKWVINILYPPNFLTLFEKFQNDYSLNKLYEPKALKSPVLSTGSASSTSIQNLNYPFRDELYNFLAGISFHEFGHSRECPMDTKHFSIILQAISTVLEQNNVFDKKLLNYIINLFTDTVVNTLYGLNIDNIFFRNSIFTFYFSELMLFNSTDISFYYFMLLNLKLFQFHSLIRNALESILIPKMPQNYEEKMKKLIAIFCPYENLAQNLKIGVNPSEDEKWKIMNFISERENWGTMAYKFAEILYEEASKEQLKDEQPVPDSTFTKLFEESEIFRKEVFDYIIKRKLQNKIKKKLGSQKKNRSKSSIEYFPGEFDIDKGLDIFSSLERLDGIYRYQLKKMEINVAKITEDSKHVISWLNREIMSERDNLSNFDPLNVYFLPKSEELLLFKKTIPLTIDLEGTRNEKGFPNLAIFCDDSGSMTWEPDKLNGKYDALIITIYSLFNWLRNKSFAPVIKYNFSFFSNTTRSTGWLDYFNLDLVKPFLFYHEGGTTNLEPSIFKTIISDPKNKAVIMITDGEIFNFKKILKILNEKKRSIIFLFIQIGKMSKFAETLKRKGFNITQIRNINKLNQIVLDFVKETYKI
ncbi:MAG: hypothetical protein ACTSRI_06470 [Promethearchaeota archaeon]